MSLLSRDPSHRPGSAGELIIPLNALRIEFLRNGPQDRLAGIAPSRAQDAVSTRTDVTVVEDTSGFLNTVDETRRENTAEESD